MTRPICKPLLPVYDKPMIYYPLAVLMEAGIREILIIIPPGEEGPFYRLLGNGSQWGVNISYEVQETPRGIADAFLVGERFIGCDSVCLVLGDNIFHSLDLDRMLRSAARRADEGATVFGYYVEDPRAFGVVEFDETATRFLLKKSRAFPKSHYIIPGIYFYDNQVIDIARGLEPSARGELEITDVNLEYLRRDQLHVIKLDRDFTWLDAGTADNLLDAAQAVKQVQDHTGRYIACLEEIAYLRGYIGEDDLHRLAGKLGQTLYGQYLMCL